MDHQTFDCLIRFFGAARSRRMAWRALRAEARPEASDGRSGHALHQGQARMVREVMQSRPMLCD